MNKSSISHYRILQRVGAGGMGEVYLAEDTKLGRKVAIKWLPPESVADEQANRRLIREAQAAAKLDHPNICAIHEIGEEDGRGFIVMQYVEGETLAARLKRRPLELRETLAVAVEIVDALAEAHGHQIIHRDIKPQNIMLTTRGQVKVLDFGLAKTVLERQAAGEETSTQSILTAPGTTVGTVPYMSPEQVRGETLDARTDIFSFGAVLYEMLSERNPFQAESVGATLSAILTKDPAPLARYTSDVPDELQRIVGKALSKDKEGRYQGIKDLLIDLRELKQELDFEAKLERSTGKELRDSRLVIEKEVSDEQDEVTTPAGVRRPARRLSLEAAVRSAAVLPFKSLDPNGIDEYLGLGMADALITKLSNISQIAVRPTSAVRKYTSLDQDPVMAGRELRVDSVLEGSIQRLGDRIRVTVQLVSVPEEAPLWAEKFDEKFTDIFGVEDSISEQVASALMLRLTGEERRLLTKHYTENVEAYQAYLKGRYFLSKRTEESLKKGIEYLSQAIDVDPTYALAYSGLADCYTLLSWWRLLPPREGYPKARAAATSALKIEDTLAEAHTSLAIVMCIYYWDWPGAESEFKQAIDLNARYALAHHWSGVHLTAMGRFDESLAEMKLTHELDPLSLIFNNGVALCFYYARKYEQAIEQLRKTLDMDPSFIAARFVLNWAYEQKGMYEEAIAEIQTAMAVSEDNPFAIALLGHTYAVCGNRSEAEKVLEELKALAKRRYVSPIDIAMIYIGLEETDQAFEWLEKAYEERSGWMVFLKVEPKFDSLRRDPRYQELLRRVGLAS